MSGTGRPSLTGGNPEPVSDSLPDPPFPPGPRGGRKVFALTEAGRAQADQDRVRDLAADPAAASQHQPGTAGRVQQLHLAARQAGAAGSPSQVEQAVVAVRAARQALYRLLAE